MGKVRARADNGKLFFDFTYLDQRCREQTTLPDTPANRKKLEKILERIEAESPSAALTTPPTSLKAARCKRSVGCRLAVHH